MQELVNKLKGMKNATAGQYDEMIKKYAHKEVMKSLQEAGIEKSDLSDEEFSALLNEQKRGQTLLQKVLWVHQGCFSF